MPNPSYWEEDEWFTDRNIHSGTRHVRPGKARDDGWGHRTSEYLTPGAHTYSTGHHRTRSQGHSPAPNVTIYNTSRLDNDSSPHVHTEQRSPMPSPITSPRGRPLRMNDDYALEAELAGLRMEMAKQRRSRSRSVHRHRRDSSEDFHYGRNPDYDKWQLQMANERLKEQDERLAREKQDELLKKRIELKYLKEEQERKMEEAKHKAEQDRLRKEIEVKQEREELERKEKAAKREEERKRIIAENIAEMEAQDRKRKAERNAAIAEFHRQQSEEEQKAKEEADRVIMAHERKIMEDKAKKERQKQELLMQIRIDEENRLAKEKEEMERFKLKLKQQEEAEKAKTAAEEAKLEDQMRKRLAQFGFQENQIQAMIKPAEQAKMQRNPQQQGMTPLNPVPLAPPPTYVKVHKEHLAVDTLIYYDIPYEIDRSDPNYIIILREMEARDTEVLFEHTRRLRSRGATKLLIEERNDHGTKEYAWVRRRKQSRSPSVSRRRSSPKRVVGIKEMFF